MFMSVTKPSWWINMLVTTFVTMLFIYIIKKALVKVNVPIASDIVKEV